MRAAYLSKTSFISKVGHSHPRRFGLGKVLEPGFRDFVEEATLQDDLWRVGSHGGKHRTPAVAAERAVNRVPRRGIAIFIRFEEAFRIADFHGGSLEDIYDRAGGRTGASAVGAAVDVNLYAVERDWRGTNQ